MSDQFEFPGLYIGCPVEISRDPSESDKTLGFVSQVGNNNCQVVSILGVHHYDVWHADDPRCLSMPHVFHEEEDDAPRGVFRLTEGEIQRRQLYRRMADLEGRLGEFFVEVRRLSGQVAELPAAEPAPDPEKQTGKRRRGRLPKQEKEAVPV